MRFWYNVPAQDENKPTVLLSVIMFGTEKKSVVMCSGDKDFVLSELMVSLTGQRNENNEKLWANTQVISSNTHY